MAKKIKSTKRKFTKILSLITAIVIAGISLFLYFNPGLYDKLMALINGEQPPLISEIECDNFYAEEKYPFAVHFIDIGQGDAILFQFPDNKTMLVDAGDNNNNNYTKLLTYISELGITTIDYLVATHADADHIGGMTDVFYNFEVKKVFRPYVYYSGDDYSFNSSYNKGSKEYKQASKTYGNFLNAIKNEKYVDDGQTKNCEWEFFTYTSDFGTNIYYNGSKTTYTVDFLTPTMNLSDIKYEDANDYSPIIKVSYCGFDILLTGDAETEAEVDFINAYSTNEEYIKYIDVDLLKVSHHGSGTSTTEDFLALTKPEIAIISCGVDNSYFHPHQQVLDRLIAYDCNLIYRTDNNGDIVLSIEKQGEYELDVLKDSADNLHAPVRK